MTEPVVKADDLWTVAEAKAKFSEVIEYAQRHGPQTITRNGKQAVVVVDAEEWERKTNRVGNLAEFFASSPLHNSGLKTRRRKDRLRATNQEADRVIEHERVIKPSARYARMILQSLDHPSPPNAKLRAALKRYKEAFGDALSRTAG